MTPTERADHLCNDIALKLKRFQWTEINEIVAEAIRQAIKDEREACAKACDGIADAGARMCAMKIRGRE